MRGAVPVLWARSRIGLRKMMWTWLLLMIKMNVVVIASSGQPSQAPRQLRIASVIGEYWSEATAIRFMMQSFNTASNRTLLPDYDVSVDHYTMQSGLADAAPVEMVRIFSNDTPIYHAIKGPRRSEAQSSIPLVAQARILHIHGGEESSRPRAAYPYSFSFVLTMRGPQATNFYIAATNGWTNIASLWWSIELLDASNEVASRLNVTNYPTLVEPDDPEWAAKAWQDNLLRLVKTARLRVAIFFMSQTLGYQAMCHIHRARILGMQYFVDPSWSRFWFLQGYPPSLGTCTADEMYLAGQGHVFAWAQHGPPGLSIYGVMGVAGAGKDESQEPYVCMPGWTITEFFNSPQHIQFALRDSPTITDFRSFVHYSVVAGMTADSICAIMHALHDALYNKNISLSSIEQRDESAFEELGRSMSQVSFRGLSGNMSFYEDLGVRTYTSTAFSQGALPDRSNGSVLTAAIFTFPDGFHESPEVTLLDRAPPIIWRDGSLGFGPTQDAGLFPDCSLVNGVLVWDRCEPCQPGSAYDPDLDACQTCPPGQFQSESGSRVCEAAAPGWYVLNTSNPYEASPCPVGFECPQVGTVDPQPCPMGSFASSPGQAACDLCPSGKFGNNTGASSCSNCSLILTDSVTANIASKSASDCICPVGAFRPDFADHCNQCPEGMRCPEGSDMKHLRALLSTTGVAPDTASSSSSTTSSSSLAYPLLKRGYMTRALEPLIVYKCGSEEHCPGGLPGTCASRRDPTTVACGDCISGSYEAGEDCKECGGADAVPMIFAGLVAIAVVMGITLVINGEIQNTPTSSFLIVVVTGLLFTSLQTMGVLHAMDVPWQEPVKSMLRLTELLSFNLDMLKGACVTGVHPVRSFGLRQSLALLLVPVVLLTLVIKKNVLDRKAAKVSMVAQLCNSMGTLWSVLFISIVVSATDPLICYEHPGGAGESVASAPSLLCFKGGDHTGMILLSACAMCLVPLPFLCLCIFAVAQYPRHIALRSGGRHFLHATRFLFIRYVPSRFYFHLLGLLRSLVVCMIPAVIRAQPAAQVLFTCVALCVYAVAVDNLQPWRASLCNISDTIMTLVLVILLLCGALFIEDPPEKEAIAALGGLAVACILVIAAVAICYGLWQRIAPAYFQHFICHHKGHAAAQARFLKILLLKHGATRVFIDSDNLKELDTLFDVVKSRVKHLVVFLTANTLKRPWCVGEIVTALRAKILITRVSTFSFVAPSSEDLESPETFVDSTGCNLNEYGINWADVTEALTTFLSSKVAQLDLSKACLGTWRFRKAASDLTQNRVNDEKKVSQSIANDPSQGVLVATDPESDEGSASAGILVDRISPEVYRSSSSGIHLLCDHAYTTDKAIQATSEAIVVVVILSEGCLQSEMLLTIICEVTANRKSRGITAGVISLNIPGFIFPSPELVANACEKLLSGKAVEHVTAFFKHISILLPTHAAQEVLNTHCEEVCRRVKQGLAFSGKELLQHSSSQVTKGARQSTSTGELEKTSSIVTQGEKGPKARRPNSKDWVVDL